MSGASCTDRENAGETPGPGSPYGPGMLAALSRLARAVSKDREERSDMILALETAGFFVVITIALRFSTWAEGWLASSSRHINERVPGVTSSAAAEFSESGGGSEAVQAA